MTIVLKNACEERTESEKNWYAQAFGPKRNFMKIYIDFRLLNKPPTGNY